MHRTIKRVSKLGFIDFFENREIGVKRTREQIIVDNNSRRNNLDCLVFTLIVAYLAFFSKKAQ